MNEVWRSHIHGFWGGWPGSSPGEIADLAGRPAGSPAGDLHACVRLGILDFHANLTATALACQAIFLVAPASQPIAGLNCPHPQSPCDPAHAMQASICAMHSVCGWDAHSKQKNIGHSGFFASASTGGLIGQMVEARRIRMLLVQMRCRRSGWNLRLTLQQFQSAAFCCAGACSVRKAKRPPLRLWRAPRQFLTHWLASECGRSQWSAASGIMPPDDHQDRSARIQRLPLV